ncbi:MAG: hypothetical protein DI547_02175, partial [Sphingobium sp.]
MTTPVLLALAALLCAALALPAAARAEDGYDLWLRYPRAQEARLSAIVAHATAIVAPGGGATIGAARDELVRGIGGMTGTVPATGGALRDGALWLATPASASGALPADLSRLGAEGYVIRYHPSRRPERSEAPRCPFAPLARYEPPPHSAV